MAKFVSCTWNQVPTLDLVFQNKDSPFPISTRYMKIKTSTWENLSMAGRTRI